MVMPLSRSADIIDACLEACDGHVEAALQKCARRLAEVEGERDEARIIATYLLFVDVGCRVNRLPWTTGDSIQLSPEDASRARAALVEAPKV